MRIFQGLSAVCLSVGARVVFAVMVNAPRPQLLQYLCHNSRDIGVPDDVVAPSLSTRSQVGTQPATATEHI